MSVVISVSPMTRAWTLFWVGWDDAVLPMEFLREKGRGDKMREPNILLLGRTVAGSGDGMEVETGLTGLL